MPRPNAARKLALVGTCPVCTKTRRVVLIRKDLATLTCGHDMPRQEAH